jgi:glyoxylase-like metal-dependent hydrolase (beta-lactamase superfamily II)
VSAATVTSLGDGVTRITHPLPFALNHVHSYALEGDDGWTIVDGGHVWDAEERWREILAELGDPPIARIVITHFHPDHIGGSSALRSVTGAEVIQGRVDREATLRLYSNGVMPAGIVPPEPDRLLEEHERIDLGGREFTVLHLPGHADGHIVLHEERTGRLFGGDVILNKITPNISWWPGMMPDPLAMYYTTLDRIEALEPTLVYPGHHGLIENAAERAAEIREHHHERLDVAERALRDGATTPDDVLVAIWGRKLTKHEHRFAYGEAVSHLVRLEGLGRAHEVEPGLWRAA